MTSCLRWHYDRSVNYKATGDNYGRLHVGASGDDAHGFAPADNQTVSQRVVRAVRHQLLKAFLEHEINEREARRIDRHRSESNLSPNKQMSSFDFSAVPRVF